MGICRSSRHKRRLTGGRRNIHQKKRKFEMGRPAANTRIGEKKSATLLNNHLLVMPLSSIRFHSRALFLVCYLSSCSYSPLCIHARIVNCSLSLWY